MMLLMWLERVMMLKAAARESVEEAGARRRDVNVLGRGVVADVRLLVRRGARTRLVGDVLVMRGHPSE